jgi:hypothetical protein
MRSLRELETLHELRVLQKTRGFLEREQVPIEHLDKFLGARG